MVGHRDPASAVRAVPLLKMVLVLARTVGETGVPHRGALGQQMNHGLVPLPAAHARGHGPPACEVPIERTDPRLLGQRRGEVWAGGVLVVCLTALSITEMRSGQPGVMSGQILATRRFGGSGLMTCARKPLAQCRGVVPEVERLLGPDQILLRRSGGVVRLASQVRAPQERSPRTNWYRHWEQPVVAGPTSGYAMPPMPLSGSGSMRAGFYCVRLPNRRPKLQPCENCLG